HSRRAYDDRVRVHRAPAEIPLHGRRERCREAAPRTHPNRDARPERVRRERIAPGRERGLSRRGCQRRRIGDVRGHLRDAGPRRGERQQSPEKQPAHGAHQLSHSTVKPSSVIVSAATAAPNLAKSANVFAAVVSTVVVLTWLSFNTTLFG